MSRELKVCRNCKHWSKESLWGLPKDGDFGECRRRGKTGAWFRTLENVPLFTRPVFYCIEHEVKDDDPGEKRAAP